MAPSKTPCPCGCGKLVASSTLKRHLRGKMPSLAQSAPYPNVSISQTISNLTTSAASSIRTTLARTFARRHERVRTRGLSPEKPQANPEPSTTTEADLDDVAPHASASPPYNVPNGTGFRDVDISGDMVLDNDNDMDQAIAAAQARAWTGRTRAARVEDVEDEEDEPEPDTTHESADEEDEMPEEDDELYEAISAWDKICEHMQRKGGITSATLTEEDLNYLRPFALKVSSHMTGCTFAKLEKAFPASNVPSWKSCQQYIAELSGFEPQVYDCCIDSCCCFVGVHAEATVCPFCKKSRFDTNNRRRQEFVYLPIIPRLKKLFSNSRIATLLRYRSSQHKHDPNVIKDIFDSRIYRSLLGKKVIIDGKTMKHAYFDRDTDMAVGVSTDGLGPFKRRQKTCWPLILFIYNLPPEIRFHLENVLSLGIIPGPKKPVDFDSFLWPLVQELLKLEVGVHAYDAVTDTFFPLRAYLLLVFGDIPAISMVMRMKGHNGFSPCRMCEIHGIRPPDTRQPTHYVPLDRGNHPIVQASLTAIKTYDPANLPLRTHKHFMEQANEVQFARTETEAENLAKSYGIKGIPALSALSSLSFPDSFPYDFMHLVWENVVKNLMLLWSGDYKGLDTGRESYSFPSAVWDAIGLASASSGSTIPSALGPRSPNVASEKASWTADSRSFWTLFIAPIVLRGRFTHDKYYNHFVDFVDLIGRCIQFEIERSEVAKIKEGFIKWVKKYEDFYYQHDPSRLSTCPLTIHALLHIADSIVAAGPVWASWAFPMERYCGFIQPAFKSRRFPFACINRFVLDHARLTHIRVLYDAADILQLRSEDLEGYRGAVCLREYTHCAFLPSSRMRTFEQGLTAKIIGALCTRFTMTPAVMRRALHGEFREWAKIRILPNGDTIRAAAFGSDTGAVARDQADSRDATFVRYELLVDKNARVRTRAPSFESQTFFGQLLHVVAVEINSIPARNLPAARVVLAIIRSCKVVEHHPKLDIHYYSEEGAIDVVDVSTVQCIVGRVYDRGRWGIFDRSGSLSRAIYIQDE